jgi:hypothetical protein
MTKEQIADEIKLVEARLAELRAAATKPEYLPGWWLANYCPNHTLRYMQFLGDRITGSLLGVVSGDKKSHYAPTGRPYVIVWRP